MLSRSKIGAFAQNKLLESLKLSLVVFLSICAAIVNAADEEQSLNITRSSAISLHDSPKYAENFSAFGYVNPDAPKGGTVVLPAFGSFDTLNPYLLKGISPINSPGFGQYGIGELNETLMVGTSFIIP
ncbi:MAG: hypothetical protein MI867_28060, partial [Pseudomonadales bacterium]|nr:hypothetical protein [Pseudomonadales bacterium]